ncbi:MAG: hypothetical protein U0324_45860 [Polyangiales bacterium]
MTRRGRQFRVWCDAAWRASDGVWALAYTIWENELRIRSKALAGFGLGLHDSNACELAACAASLKGLLELAGDGSNAIEAVTVHSDNLVVGNVLVEPYRQKQRIRKRSQGFAIALETIRSFVREFPGVLRVAHVRAHQRPGLSEQTDRNREVDDYATKASKRLLALMPPGPWSEELRSMSVRDPSFGGTIRDGKVHLMDISHVVSTIKE